MTSIAIVTDTDSSIPFDIAEQHNIQQAPINIHFGKETLKTEIEINDVQLFERIDREGKIPTTSAPSPGQFAEAYKEAFETGADYLSFLRSAWERRVLTLCVLFRQIPNLR